MLGLHDTNGSIYATETAPDVNSRFLGGLAYSSLAHLHITTSLSGTDVFTNGFRVSVSGQVVVGPNDAAGQPYNYNAGLPYDKRDGRLIRQTGVPAPTDPFINGTRVNSLGVFMNVSGGGGGGEPTNAILAENGDFIMSEAGDYIIQE